MRPFSIDALKHASVSDLVEIRARIDMSPPYQRQSDVWTPAKRQLFIDSLLNGFDIPKLYLHDLLSAKLRDKGYLYAVVDGKQRLETIWAFVDGDLELADDFYWYENPKARLGSKKYSELPPKLQAQFDGYKLPVQVLHADDLEWVEELFSRLNEAVALNAPEHRNAMGGPLPQIIRALPTRPFFTDQLPFENTRYKHLDLATKLLFLEHRGGPAETKRGTLDDFVEEFKSRGAQEAKLLEARTTAVLKRLEGVFGKRDSLLRSLGLVVIYYLLERDKVLSTTRGARHILIDFDGLRRQIRSVMRSSGSDTDQTSIRLDPELVEFERLSQSPNDVKAMTDRMSTLRRFIENPNLIETRLEALT